jgi:hypothetical protein
VHKTRKNVARVKEYERQAQLLQQFFSMTKSQCPETTAELGEPSTSKDKGSISEREAGEDADVTNQEEDSCRNGHSISEEVSQARDDESRGSSAFSHLSDPAVHCHFSASSRRDCSARTH